MPKDKNFLDTCDDQPAFMAGDIAAAFTEHEQCFGKQHENREEQDLDDWLDGQIQ